MEERDRRAAKHCRETGNKSQLQDIPSSEVYLSLNTEKKSLSHCGNTFENLQRLALSEWHRFTIHLWAALIFKYSCMLNWTVWWTGKLQLSQMLLSPSLEYLYSSHAICFAEDKKTGAAARENALGEEPKETLHIEWSLMLWDLPVQMTLEDPGQRL